VHTIAVEMNRNSSGQGETMESIHCWFPTDGYSPWTAVCSRSGGTPEPTV